MTDVSNFHLLLPTLEYHNKTWTWLDLLLAMKGDCKRVLISQVTCPHSCQLFACFFLCFTQSEDNFKIFGENTKYFFSNYDGVTMIHYHIPETGMSVVS